MDGLLVVPRDLDENGHLRVRFWRIAGRRPDRGRVAVEVEIHRGRDADGAGGSIERLSVAGQVESHAYTGRIGPLPPLRAGDVVLFSARLTHMPLLGPLKRAAFEVALLDSSVTCPDAETREGEVTPPRRISTTPRPQYTEEARKARITGVAVVQTIMGCDGRLTRFRVLKSLDAGLDQESFETLSQWRYEPARLDGIPVSVFFHFTINFQLQTAALSGSSPEPVATVEGRLVHPRP